MNDSLHRKTSLFGAWCAVFYCILLFLGWWVIAGYFPLHEPSAGPDEIATFYSSNITGIRIGMVMLMWGAGLYLPFAAVLSDQVAKIEGRNGPLSKTVLLAGYANAMLTFYPPLYWLTIAFRPGERSNDLVYLLNDIGWLQFIGGLALAMPTYIAVGVASLSKQGSEIFPRWVGYLSFMVFILLLPDQLLFFFKTGPFAWNGLFAFWIPIVVFSAWFLVMFYVIRRNVLRS